MSEEHTETEDRSARLPDILPEMPNFPDALCKYEDPELWFPVEGLGLAIPNAKRAALAIAICEECPRLDECRDYALTNRIEEGTWGGLSEADRQTIWAQDEREAS